MSEKLVITKEEQQNTWSYWLSSFFYTPEEDDVEKAFMEKNHGDLGKLDLDNIGFFEDNKNVKVLVTPLDLDDGFDFDDEKDENILIDFHKM